jgi:RNA polymerase-associated protein RTF1
MPLKKRFADKDDDEEEEEEEEDDKKEDGYDSELSFGEDLFKDDEDRAKLMAMSELDREMILAERSER